MTVVTKHDTEHEWEGHHCEAGRIGLLVAGNTVGVGELLEEPSHVVKFEVSRGSQLVGSVLVLAVALELRSRVNSQSFRNSPLLFKRCPEEPNVSSLTRLHLAKRSIDSLLLSNQPFLRLKRANLIG